MLKKIWHWKNLISNKKKTIWIDSISINIFIRFKRFKDMIKWWITIKNHTLPTSSNNPWMKNH